MTTTVYLYQNCDTCRKARKWLEANDIDVRYKAIRETPPSKAELRRVLASLDGEVKRLFNTSSQDYRAGGFKDRLAGMSETEVFAALQANGNLVKRPFVVDQSGGLVGFRPDEWAAWFESR